MYDLCVIWQVGEYQVVGVVVQFIVGYVLQQVVFFFWLVYIDDVGLYLVVVFVVFELECYGWIGGLCVVFEVLCGVGDFDWFVVEWCFQYQYLIVMWYVDFLVVFVQCFGIDQGGWIGGMLVEIVWVFWYIVYWYVVGQWQVGDQCVVVIVDVQYGYIVGEVLVGYCMRVWCFD